MKASELSGLMLTHGERNPGQQIGQMAGYCGQIVIVHDSRGGNFDEKLVPVDSDCEVVIVERPFDNFPNQRNAGIAEAMGKWILLVDSDEVVSSALANEITELNPPESAEIYGMERVDFLNGRPLKFARFHTPPKGLHPRLFRSSLQYGTQPASHPEFVGEHQTDIIPLKGVLEHHTAETTVELIRKCFHYGRLQWSQGQEGAGQGSGNLPYAKFARFLAGYIREDGLRGAAVGMMQVAYGMGLKFPYQTPSRELTFRHTVG